jgi:hypothetical protein
MFLAQLSIWTPIIINKLWGNSMFDTIVQNSKTQKTSVAIKYPMTRAMEAYTWNTNVGGDVPGWRFSECALGHFSDDRWSIPVRIKGYISSISFWYGFHDKISTINPGTAIGFRLTNGQWFAQSMRGFPGGAVVMIHNTPTIIYPRCYLEIERVSVIMAWFNLNGGLHRMTPTELNSLEPMTIGIYGELE